jgi:nucleoside-diphosphate-sugar epimerase
LTDPQAIAGAVKDADAVISLLGPPSKPALGRFDVAPILEGYRHIVAAMETHGVRRLVALGTPSINDDADRWGPALSILVVAGKRFKPAAYQTMVGIGEIVCASELDWTIVRVPLLTDGPRTERINVGTLGDKAVSDCPAPTLPPTSSNRPRTPPGSVRPRSSSTSGLGRVRAQRSVPPT